MSFHVPYPPRNSLLVPLIIKIIDKTYRKVNDVEKRSATGRPVSSGRNCNVPQAALNRHQASTCKRKEITKIATWNENSMLQKGKLDITIREMERIKINILDI